MYENSLASVIAEIEVLLAERMSARGRDLDHKLKHVGRRLPAKVRAQAAYLVQVQNRARNPKLAHQYDPAQVVKAHKICVEYLQKFDRRAYASYGRLSWFTGLLVNLSIIMVLFALAAYYLTRP